MDPYYDQYSNDNKSLLYVSAAGWLEIIPRTKIHYLNSFSPSWDSYFQFPENGQRYVLLHWNNSLRYTYLTLISSQNEDCGSTSGTQMLGQESFDVQQPPLPYTPDLSLALDLLLMNTYELSLHTQKGTFQQHEQLYLPEETYMVEENRRAIDRLSGGDDLGEYRYLPSLSPYRPDST